MIRIVLLALYDAVILPFLLLLWLLRRRQLRHPQPVKLHLDRMPDIAPRGRIRRASRLERLAELLEAAGRDARVTGLFVTLDSGSSISLADASELGALLLRFKRSGKPLHVRAEHIDARMMVAAAGADRISTGPAGVVMVHGAGVEIPFLGGLLDRAGIQIQGLQRGAFKGITEPLTRSHPTEPFAESVQSLVDGTFDRLAEAVAGRPGWDIGRARAALARGPYTIRQALAAGLIDAAEEGDAAETLFAEALHASDSSGKAQATGRRLRKPATGAVAARLPRRIVDISRVGLLPPRLRSPRAGPRLAFVPISGIIVDRPVTTVARRQMAVASRLASSLRRLADTGGIEAIVLVVNSRGGTATGSDQIWSAVKYAMGRKPVVAWMRNYAASGGYYVASAAERIVASPFTTTGSIGVAMLKPNAGRLAADMGINPVFIGRGQGADLFSPFRPFSETDLEWLNASLDEAYDRFKQVVAEGRRMTAETVETVAQGRVWTGPQALDRGLVDKIGHFADVVATARELAGIPAARRHELVWVGPREAVAQALWRALRPPGADMADLAEGLMLPLLLQHAEPLYYLP